MKNLLLSFKKKSIMPSNLLAMLISHMGFAVLIAAIFINSILHEDKQYKLKVGEEATFRQFQIKLSDVYIMEHENYFSYTANIILTTAEGNVLGNLHPEIRFFPAVKQHTIETSIWKTTFYDIYIVMEKLPDQDDQFVFSVMYRPMIGWIWLSCILFFIAGVYRFCVIITTQHIRFKKAYSERN